MNKYPVAINSDGFNPDLAPSDGRAGRWAEYLKGTRLLLVSRDEQLKAIYHDSSLTQAEKFERSNALFESTNKIESFLNPNQAPKFEESQEQPQPPSCRGEKVRPTQNAGYTVLLELGY